MFLERIPKLNVQRLFALALILKVLSSAASVWLNSTWVLGLAVPISIMVVYMVIGHFCREDDVSMEKFADSCYYLGFIFTITSIIVSLFDLPNLGAGDGMRNIAVRFGAAMISTVLGMGVRVYLVSFRKDTSDAIRDVEDAVLDSSRMLVTQLGSIMDTLKQFEQQVGDAAKLTVENVNRQVEALGTNYAESLNSFYVKVTEENKVAFAALLDEVKVATTRLADSVDNYSGGMKGNLESIERKVTEFANAVTNRLANTTFPDDFFAREFKGPLAQLRDEAAILGQSVRTVSSEVEASSSTLAAVLNKIMTKTKKTEAALDAVVSLSEQQQTIVTNADLQLNSLVKVAERLEQVDAAIKCSVLAISSNSNVSSDLLAKVASLSNESSSLRIEIKEVMSAMTTKLDANATLATGVIQKLEAQAGQLRVSAIEVVSKIAAQTESSGIVAQRLFEAAAVNQDVAKHLQSISTANQEVIMDARQAGQNAARAAENSQRAAQSAAAAVESVGTTAVKVSETTGQLKELNALLRLQTGGLLDAANKLHLSQESQPAAVADAVLQAIANRPVTATVDSLVNVSHLDPILAYRPAHFPEPITDLVLPTVQVATTPNQSAVIQ